MFINCSAALRLTRESAEKLRYVCCRTESGPYWVYGTVGIYFDWDAPNTADANARQFGMDRVLADVSPARIVAMAVDGITGALAQPPEIPMMKSHYVWLIWACSFLLLWVILYLTCNLQQRRAMWCGSIFMAPFGLTEPFFVPEYWNPPSLFELAQRTGFDIESIIFSFAIGGIGAVLYNSLTRRHLEPVDPEVRHQSQHGWHRWALATPFVSFLVLLFLPWNPIYAGIAAMVLGAITSVLCRPDLKTNTLVGGVLFLAIYTLFLLGLKWSAPGYIEQVWNLKALSGVVIYGLPLEELLFGFSFGLVWTGIYEHFTWKRSVTSIFFIAGG